MSLANNWYIACRSGELGKHPLPRRLFSTNYVLWRDSAGNAHAVLDRCAHRNAPLSSGRVEDNCIVCPYHGWSYEGGGTCVKVPSLAAGRRPPVAAKVPACATTEQDGFVWICPGEPPPAPPRPFPHYGDKGWTSFRMHTRFEAGLEACLENFLDCPHTATVHRGWFRNPDQREMDAIVRRGTDFVEVEFENEPTTDSLIARLFYPRNCQLKHIDRFHMPNLSRVDYEFDADHHFIITSQATPVDDAITDVETVITFRYGKIGWLVRLLFEPMSRRIIQQDVDILKLQGANVAAFGGADYVNAETDLIALHMRSLRRRADQGEPPVTDTAEKRIRIRF
jgi:phenylpropionate dioxygenase-like ring-hydroxylating dioxygenase large terminal subunit